MTEGGNMAYLLNRCPNNLGHTEVIVHQTHAASGTIITYCLNCKLEVDKEMRGKKWYETRRVSRNPAR